MVNPDLAPRTRPTLSLTPDEDLYLSQVEFDLLHSSSGEQQRSMNAAASLAKSLLGRGAVPKIRWRFFTDRELNIGAAISREEALEAKCLYMASVLMSPGFLPVLQYWIYGPQLPEDVIRAFMQAVAHGTDVSLLRRSVRQVVRAHNLPPDGAAEEFYKLALEAGLDSETAWSIHNSVRGLRPRQALPMHINREEGQS